MRRWRHHRLQGLDVACAEQLGYRIKLLGVARRRKEGDADGVELRVQPARWCPHAFAGTGQWLHERGDGEGRCGGRDDVLWRGRRVTEQTASAVIADLVDVARLQGTTPAQRVPHQGFHAHAVNEQLAVLPRAAVHTRHHLRVPVHTAQQMEEVSADGMAAQQVPVQRVNWRGRRPGAGCPRAAAPRHKRRCWC